MGIRGLKASLLTALAMAAAAASAAPRHMTLVYELSHNDQPIAEVVDVLSYDESSYAIVSEAKAKGALAILPLGFFKRESRGSVTGGGLRPDYFREQRGTRIAEANFDWRTRQLTLEYRGNVESRELEEPLHDRLTLAYHFLFAPLLPVERIAIRVTDGRGVSEASYQVADDDSVVTAAGNFKTVRLEKIRAENDERDTTIWLSRTQPRLPVRILIVEKDGTRLDQVLLRILP